jgi:excisionase family DNA binding protein
MFSSLYTIPEACKILRVCEPTIYKLIGTGKLKTYRFGGSRRVSHEQLSAFLESSVATPDDKIHDGRVSNRGKAA